MERIWPEKSILMATHQWRLYEASSIVDMLNSKNDVVAEMKTEHAQWVAGLDFRGRLRYAKDLFISLLSYPDPFTYLYLGKVPSIEDAPRTLVLLPRVQHYPAKDKPSDSWEIKISDATGTVDVEFPYSWIANTGRVLFDFQVDRETLRESSWSSPVILFNVYDPWPRSFLMKVFKTRVREKVKEKLELLVPNLSPTTAEI